MQIHVIRENCEEGTERLSEPEDQEVCCEIASPRNDKEAMPE